MSVFDLSVGDSGYIKVVNLSGSTAARLTSLGVVVGKKITVLSVSLFKSSVLIGCGAVRLGLRKSLAKNIEVGKCG